MKSTKTEGKQLENFYQYTNVSKNFNLIRYFIIGLLVFCGVLVLAFSIAYVKLYRFNLEHVLVLNSAGEILPKELVEKEKSHKIEAQNHIKHFIEYFFEYDPFNYQERIEKALWLGDDSIKEAYLKIKDVDGWYDKVVQNALIQKIKWGDIAQQIKIQRPQQDVSPFSASVLLEVNLSGNKKIYQLETKGKLLRVSRNFPWNPHGFLITNFIYQLNEPSKR